MFYYSVSIHVPLAEHDMRLDYDPQVCIVSIHVPLAEHDADYQTAARPGSSFNSRAPRGARQFDGR